MEQEDHRQFGILAFNDVRYNPGHAISVFDANNPMRQAMRIRIRFGLKSLLLSVTVACIIVGSSLSWYRSQKAEFERQQIWMNRLVATGAFVEQKCDSFLERWKFFQRITGVLCGSDTDIDAVLDEVPHVSSLQQVTSFGSVKIDARLRDRVNRMKAEYPSINFKL